MGMKIELNGQLITGTIDGVDQFKVSQEREGNDNQQSKSFTSELTFFDDGYDIIKAILIDDPNGFTNSIEIKIFDDCCAEEVFKGFLRGDSIDWCEPDCSVTASAVQDDAALNCIKSTMIFDDWNGFEMQNQPPVRYCIETRPAFLQIWLITLVYGLNTLMIVILIPICVAILVIFAIIYVICQVIAAICFLIPGVSPPDCNGGLTNPITIIQGIIDLLRDFNEDLVGCGKFHPSPYVRSYIENVCGKCGLTFQSSILNDASSVYYHAVLFAAEVEKGRPNQSTTYRLIQANKPLLTLTGLLTDYLKPVFNADWRVIGNVLLFERKDYFSSLSTWISAPDLLDQGRIIDQKICFNWTDKDRPAFGRFEWASDAQDYVGNEAKPRYDDIVEWNSPVSPLQSGEHFVSLPFAPCRNRDDDIEFDVHSFFANALGGAINAMFFGAFSSYENSLLMNQHTAFQYKLLIIDPDSSPSFAKVMRTFPNGYTGGNLTDVDGNTIAFDARFNYPLWFVENRDYNLYSNFHYIDNPRLPGATQFDFEFEFEFNCDEFVNFDFDKTIVINKGGQSYNAIPQEIEVDFIKRVINVKGTL